MKINFGTLPRGSRKVVLSLRNYTSSRCDSKSGSRGPETCRTRDVVEGDGVEMDRL